MKIFSQAPGKKTGLMFLFVAILLFACRVSQAQETDSIKIEPKANFEVNIGNIKYELAEGEELILDSVPGKPVISIKLANHKTFRTSFISFQYPGYLSFDAERGDAHRQWSLSGNDVNVLVHEMNGRSELSELMELMVKRFGRKNCRVSTIYTDLGGISFAGKELMVTIAGVSIIFHYYWLPSADNKTRFIAFQDKVSKSGGRTDEFEKCFAMVDKTIRFY